MSEAGGGGLLAVNARDAEELRVALAGPEGLVDLRWSRTDRTSQVGDIHLGVVRQVEPGLDAAFIDIGDSRAAFLHVGNVHPGFAAGGDPFAVAAQPSRGHPALDEVDGAVVPEQRIDELLSPGRRVLVQVLRDPQRGKGATLTTYLSLAGHLMVWMPALRGTGVSRRIDDPEERTRLRAELAALGDSDAPLPVIARTAAEGAARRALRRDLDRLQARWERVRQATEAATAPALVLAEESPALRAARELYHGGVERVVVDDATVAAELQGFLSDHAGRASLAVELHEKARPLFEALGIEQDYQGLFRSRVPIEGGASIVLHETEALCAIDVNSGRKGGGTLEETALRTNLAASREIARQARLRDLGGIVVVDFIDMQRAAHRREVEQALRDALRRDRARLKCGRLGTFGLMSFTRRRVGTGLPRAAEALCRGCGGSGTVAHHQAGALRAVRRLRAFDAGAGVRLRAQPGVVEQLRRHHREALAGLGFEVELVEDVQVASGEPVLERQDGLAAGPDPG